jgi:hypothetical protein
LALAGLAYQARGEVDGVAEHVVVALHYRAVLEADANAELRVLDHRQRVDGMLHVGRRARGGVGRREKHHHLIADRLDDAPAERSDERRRRSRQFWIASKRLRVARSLVELRAAADVGEQYRGLPGGIHALPGRPRESMTERLR